jgi:phosphoribosylanthranilate isomerase
MAVRVKICGITRLEDALFAVNAGADALGFVFYDKSPRHVTPAQAAIVCRALPPFITRVGLFVDASVEFVQKVLQTVPLDLLQFHGDEPPAYCAQFGKAYIKAVRVHAATNLLKYAADFDAASGLLLDAYVESVPGGTGEAFDWKLIPKNLPKLIVLSGGLTPGNVDDAVKQTRPWAVDVSSGVESAKGIKDMQKVAQFIANAKAS